MVVDFVTGSTTGPRPLHSCETSWLIDRVIAFKVTIEMTDIYVVNNQELERTTDSESSTLPAILGAMLIICLPTAFWMGIIEVANLFLGLGLDATTRLLIAGTLAGVLLVVWCFVTVSARQMRHQDQAGDLAVWPVKTEAANDERLKA
jgi:hypothetical protein